MADVSFILDEAEATIRRIADSSANGFSDMDGLILEAERLLRDVSIVADLLPSNGGEVLLQCIADIYTSLENKKLLQDHHQRGRGRPRVFVSEEQLSLLLSFQFSVSDIASMLRVSSSTVKRRIVQYGLESMTDYSDITDLQLDMITNQFIINHPCSGEKSFEGYLRQMGLRVQRQRIRNSLQRIDCRGIRSRFNGILHRRVYSVPMPNSLWHIDGHHKLIRWRIIVHGGIDGFSRLPVYLRASNNNKSETVLQCFLGAVTAYGLPSRVRCDKGRENVLVSQHMLNHPERGPGRGAALLVEVCITRGLSGYGGMYLWGVYICFMTYSMLLKMKICSTLLMKMICFVCIIYFYLASNITWICFVRVTVITSFGVRKTRALISYGSKECHS